MDLKLSPYEQGELTKAASSFNLDHFTKTLTLKYYLEYRHKIGQIYLEKLPLIINCAILAASKSQVLTTVKGEKVRGIGISITQLMRGFSGPNNTTTINFDEFLIVLKEFIGTVTLSSDVASELRAIIEKFAFSHAFFIKYSDLFKQMDLKETSFDHDDYLKYLKNFGWLLFINAKSSLLHNQTELVESFFLLTATFAHILSNLPNHISIGLFDKNPKRNIYDKNKKKNEEAILEGLQELIKLGSNGGEDIKSYSKSLQDYLSKLMENEVLKSEKQKSFEGMYDSKVLYTNYTKLEGYYQKKLNQDDLDERFFIRERKKPHTPGKFTPFARQGAANKLAANFGMQRFNRDQPQSQNQTPSSQMQQDQAAKKPSSSHRLLNYEVSEQVTMRTNLSEIKFAARQVPPSPYTRLMPATPMTRALEMYNWLSDKTRVKRGNNGLTVGLEKCLSAYGDNKLKELIINRANRLVEKVLLSDKIENLKNPQYQKKIREKHSQIVSLYLRVLEEMLSQEEKKVKDSETQDILRSDNFHKALIACCVETTFFVNNTSGVSFVRLLDICDVDAFEFWRIIDNFVKFDLQMPYPIKKHLYDLELKILMYLAWKKNSTIHQVIKNQSLDHDFDFDYNNKENRAPEMNESSISTDNNQDITKSSDTTIDSSEKKTKIQQQQLKPSHELFFKRVLHFTALQVYQLCDLLHLNEKIAEQIWGVMKYILSSEVNLVIGRHVEQLILCAVYGVCKISNQPLKFQEIITKYQELPSFNKNEFLEIIHKVYMSDGVEKIDLIKFYNTIFITQTRTFLFSLLPDRAQVEMKSATPMIRKPVISALVMESPLRESLPQHMFGTKGGKSPMLKFGYPSPGGTSQTMSNTAGKLNDTANNLVSKRQINFDEANDSNNNVLSAKKPKIPHQAVMDKIVEHNTEEAEMDSNKKVMTKKSIFGVSGVKKNMNFEESPNINFTQMYQSKNSMMFQSSVKTAKMNLDNGSNSPLVSENNAGVHNKIFKTLTPEFKK